MCLRAGIMESTRCLGIVQILATGALRSMCPTGEPQWATMFFTPAAINRHNAHVAAVERQHFERLRLELLKRARELPQEPAI